MAFKRETSARKQNSYSTYEPERPNVLIENESIQGMLCLIIEFIKVPVSGRVIHLFRLRQSQAGYGQDGPRN